MAASVEIETEKKKGKIIGGDNGEIRLPEAMIQHIQSYLTRKEAARTAILAKSWYNAWLTRPVIDLDYYDFHPGSPSPLFEEFAKKTVQRYQCLRLKIERFRLRVGSGCSWAHDLVVNAINIGATDVEIDMLLTDITLPKEVLGSQTLLRLSVSGNGIQTLLAFDDPKLFARCSRLQSLSLANVNITSYEDFKDLISCCGSMEELSLANIRGMKFSRANLPKLHNLRRLTLNCVYVDDDTFFTDFASRFPCLKDLDITVDYDTYTRVGIASTSLQTIHLTTMGWSRRASFDVPNIRKFTFTCYSLPSQILIEGGLTEWELVIILKRHHFPRNSWFLKLKKLLTDLRLSRISLYLNRDLCNKVGRSERDLDIEVVPKPLVLEELVINAPSYACLALLLRFFGICRPKFINGIYLWSSGFNLSFPILYNKLMQKSINPNCGIPDQDMFGKFGLKKVNMEVYEKVDSKWLPLVLEKPLDPSKTPVKNQMIQFELIWD